MTANDLITSALRLAGVLANGETPAFDDANSCLSVLNDMIDAWNADRLAIYTTRSDDFPFVLNQQSYTLGAGGNFNIPRPARIDSMSAILLQNPGNPIEEPMAMWTVEQWQNDIPVKKVDGSWPLGCYDDGGFPLRTLNFWPIPTQPLNSVRIYSWQALPAQTLTSQISFPPGYSEALRYNLAVRLAAEFKAPQDSVVVELAIRALATIKTMNAPDLSLKSDLVPNSLEYNYRADMFGIPY